jgi:hypothetical protein
MLHMIETVLLADIVRWVNELKDVTVQEYVEDTTFDDKELVANPYGEDICSPKMGVRGMRGMRT